MLRYLELDGLQATGGAVGDLDLMAWVGAPEHSANSQPAILASTPNELRHS